MNKKLMSLQRCTNILSHLIKINSCHPEGNEMEIVNYILGIFKDKNIKYKIFDHKNNRGSLIITISGKNSNDSTAFIGHIDTVPVVDEKEWIYPPFDAVIDNGYMYGRGSVDMKSGVTSMIVTALYLLENNLTPKKDIHFCFTADEESGGMGVLSIMESEYLKNVREVFICEPSDLKLGLAEKGALWLKIDVKGNSCHSSRPELGVNAIETLVELIDKVKEKLNFEKTNKYLGCNTLAVTQLNGGVKSNMIPSHAKAILDIRTIPGFSHDKIIQMVKIFADNMMKEQNELYINIEIHNNRCALEVSENSGFIKNITSIYKNFSLQYEYKGIYFYTDASQVIPKINVPFIILGPGEDKLAHQKNERVKLKDVLTAAEIYTAYILKCEEEK